ncbi:MAG: dolichyl-phosphate-mannose--protein mannosyltransferase [Bacteroidales bacterium]|nr:dolichyl-phosphate-mannose--protein mannosyltransferase [Bacteroidales bacterium]
MMNNKLQINKIIEKYPIAAVCLFAFICLFPAMLLRDFTPSNELRYLSIADEAIAGGNIFAFTNHGVPYADKPPLYFWIVMLCRLIFGHHSCFALSLFSLVPAFVIVNVMDKWVMSKAPVADRMAAAMMLLTCGMFLGTAVVLRMDMLMCMFIVLALRSFYRIYTGEDVSGKESWMLPVWTFMALFTKGPVGLIVPPLGILVFLVVKGKWRETGRYLGWKTWGVIAVLFALWILAAFLDGGKEYINNLLFKQTVGRAVNAFTHNKPFWFYLAAIWWSVAPYCLLLVGAFVTSLLPAGRKSHPQGERCDFIPASAVRSDAEVLFVCVIAATFVMLSSFSSKLPVYLCPIFPFMVYLFPMVLERTGGRRWMGWAIGIPVAILAVAGLAASVALSGLVRIEALDALLEQYPFVSTISVKIAVLLLFAGNALALYVLVFKKIWNLPIFLTGASMMLMIYAASCVIGQVNPYIGYGPICSAVPGDSDVAVLYMRRPENMDVYLGRDLTDYRKDVDSFIKDLGSRTKGSAPLTLLITADRMQKSEELMRIVNERGTCTFSGPYCAVTFRQD